MPTNLGINSKNILARFWAHQKSSILANYSRQLDPVNEPIRKLGIRQSDAGTDDQNDHHGLHQRPQRHLLFFSYSFWCPECCVRGCCTFAWYWLKLVEFIVISRPTWWWWEIHFSYQDYVFKPGCSGCSSAVEHTPEEQKFLRAWVRTLGFFLLFSIL